MLEKYELLPIFRRYQSQKFYEAQSYLKRCVTELLNELDEEKIVENRRLEKKAEFVAYVQSFAKELADLETIKVPESEITMMPTN